MLVGMESDLLEWKATLDGNTKETVRQAICAFANDLPGRGRAGVILVGIGDDAQPSGLVVDDQLLRTLADMRTDGNILPPPTMRVRRGTLRGSPVAIVEVEPSASPPVRLRGQSFVRTGPRRGIATRDDERVLNERRRTLDRYFDAEPVPTARVSDLDLLLFERQYLPAALAPEVLATNGRTIEQKLSSLKMVASADSPIPTVAGLLVLGIRPRDFIPGAYIQFLRVRGVERSDPVVDAAEIDGNLLDIQRGIDEKLRSCNLNSVDFVSADLEVRRETFPIAALQQIVRNAMMHRSYEGTSAPVQVLWFDHHVEVVSPGGPFGAVNVDNFGEPGVVDYRNPILAEAMKVLGLVQRFGFGIPTARRLLREAGHREPEFRCDSSWVYCTIKGLP